MQVTRSFPAFFISADWSKDSKKRSVHVAELARRKIWREDRARWNLQIVLALARELSQKGTVLVGLDLALGVPAGYWAELTKRPRWTDVESFPRWLRTLDPSSAFFETVRDPAAWRVDQPFFSVPAGVGGLKSFQSRVAGGLLRRIDACTGAKPLFAVSGIPGTVGSGTRELWKELIPSLTSDRDFAVWPFEGALSELLAERRIVLAETYPGLAYAAAIAKTLATQRILVSKTKRDAREQVCDVLEDASWVREAGADLGDVARARADEDAFDSLLTAAAVLRCSLEGLPLCTRTWLDETAEGAMLMAGPVDPALRARRFRLAAGSSSAAPASRVTPAARLAAGGGRAGSGRAARRDVPGRRP